MKLRAIFESQARVAAGVQSVSVEVQSPDGQLTREQIVRAVASHGTSQLSDFLLDSSGTVRSSVLVFLGDTMMMPNETSIILKEETDIVITSLISGG